MQNLRIRMDKLEAENPPQGAPVYLFGDSKADLEARIAIAENTYPGRPLIGFRWKGPEEAIP
jgi:hypothetical protein